MSLATIYATAIHKRSENQGYFGYAVWKKNAKKPTEKLENYQCDSKIRLQLRTLIDGISALKNSEEYDDVKEITDFALISNLQDGTVMEWEKNNWVKSNEKPVPEADLWKELNDLAVEYNILFTEPKESDTKMNDLIKRTKNPKKVTGKKPKKEVKVETSIEEPRAEVENLPLENQVALEEVVVSPAPIATPTVPKAEKTNSAIPSEFGTLKIPLDLLKDCEEMCKEIGLPVEMAVTMFLKESLRKRGLTLDMKL